MKIRKENNKKLSLLLAILTISMLKPTMSNTFSERTQLAPTPVIIDKKPKYEISQIVDSKIDHQ